MPFRKKPTEQRYNLKGISFEVVILRLITYLKIRLKLQCLSHHDPLYRINGIIIMQHVLDETQFISYILVFEWIVILKKLNDAKFVL